MTRLLPALVAALFAAGASVPAHAQLFGGDDTARKQISELRDQVNGRLDTLSRGQFDLINQNESLRNEIASLRGQVEVLTHELEALKQRQRDFYLDLDKRMQSLEGGGARSSSSAAPFAPAAATTAQGDDPIAAAASQAGSGVQAAAAPAQLAPGEGQAYEAALNLLRGGKHTEALSAFNSFIARHPQSAQLPGAHFWAGNAALSARDISAARQHFNTVLQRWPQDRVAPDAMLGLSSTQQALGDGRGSQETLRKVIAEYPDSQAAKVAQQRLGQ